MCVGECMCVCVQSNKVSVIAEQPLPAIMHTTHLTNQFKPIHLLLKGCPQLQNVKVCSQVRPQTEWVTDGAVVQCSAFQPSRLRLDVF